MRSCPRRLSRSRRPRLVIPHLVDLATAVLQRIGGRAVRLVEVLEVVVADLKRIRYESQAEQIDGRVIVYERALDRAGKILTDLARLNLDERLVRVSEAQGLLLNQIISGVLGDVGASAEMLAAVRPALATRLRLAEAGKPQPSRLVLALPGGGR